MLSQANVRRIKAGIAVEELAEDIVGVGDAAEVDGGEAREEGVDVEIMVAEGMPHVWPVMDVLPESVPAREDIVRFINSRWQAIRPLYSVPRR